MQIGKKAEKLENNPFTWVFSNKGDSLAYVVPKFM
jgi:hypothetical protein